MKTKRKPQCRSVDAGCRCCLLVGHRGKHVCADTWAGGHEWTRPMSRKPAAKTKRRGK